MHARRRRNERFGGVKGQPSATEVSLVAPSAVCRLTCRRQVVQAIEECLSRLALLGTQPVLEFRDVDTGCAEDVAFREGGQQEAPDGPVATQVRDERGRIQQVTAQAADSVLRVDRTHSAALSRSVQAG